MKKIIITLVLLGALGFAPFVLTGAAKMHLDFQKFNKAISLLKESESLMREGKSVKSDKKKKEVDKILNAVFRGGKVITIGNNCSLKKNQYQNRWLELSCDESPLEKGGRVIFVFKAPNDSMLDPKHSITKAAVVEVYEEKSQSFTGKVKLVSDFTKRAYSLDSFSSKDIPIMVKCVLLSLKPI